MGVGVVLCGRTGGYEMKNEEFKMKNAFFVLHFAFFIFHFQPVVP
jgi:hypothetical protein